MVGRQGVKGRVAVVAGGRCARGRARHAIKFRTVELELLREAATCVAAAAAGGVDGEPPQLKREFDGIHGLLRRMYRW